MVNFCLLGNMSLQDEINKLNRIRRETSNYEIEELLRNLVKSLETIQDKLNEHEDRLYKID